MKRFAFFTTVILIALNFASCGKDNGGGSDGSGTTISGTIVNVPAGTGNFTVEGHYYDKYGTGGLAVSVPVGQNGAFSFTLPTPPAGVLASVYKIFEGDSGGVQISNPNVLGMDIYFKATNTGLGVRCVSTDNPISKEIYLFYVDNDVTVTGNGIGSDGKIYSTYALSLQKGWNKILIVYSSTGIPNYTTSNVPSDLFWKLDTGLNFLGVDGGNNGGGGPSAFDGTISGTIVNLPAGTGDFTMYGYYTANDDDQGSSVVSATVHNGVFSFSLPTPSSSALLSLDDTFEGTGLYINNPNVHGRAIYFSSSISDILCVSTDNPISRELCFYYADNDVTITGTDADYGDTYYVSFKKGWNKMLITYSSTGAWTYTTGNIPSGLVWKLDTGLSFLYDYNGGGGDNPTPDPVPTTSNFIGTYTVTATIYGSAYMDIPNVKVTIDRSSKNADGLVMSTTFNMDVGVGTPIPVAISNFEITKDSTGVETESGLTYTYFCGGIAPQTVVNPALAVLFGQNLVLQGNGIDYSDAEFFNLSGQKYLDIELKTPDSFSSMPVYIMLSGSTDATRSNQVNFRPIKRHAL